MALRRREAIGLRGKDVHVGETLVLEYRARGGDYRSREIREPQLKEALLAYYCLLTAQTPLTREALDAQVEAVLARVFGVSADFEIDDALARLKRLDLLAASDGRLSVPPLADALARLDKEWKEFFAAPAGKG